MGNKESRNNETDLKEFVKEINLPSKDESYIDDRFKRKKDGDVSEFLRGNSKYRFQSKVVRVYVCSTFLDMQNEIEYLMDSVYPKLKDFCRQVVDVQFQILNMKFDEPFVVDVTPKMLLEEIKNCYSESISPCIVVLIGHQYGPAVLPETIPRKDFELIEIELKKILMMQKYFKEFDVQSAFELFSKFYRLDKNEIPEAYRLAEIYQSQSLYDHIQSDGQAKRIRIDPTSIGKLQQVLSLGARHCSEQGLFSLKQEKMFSKSIFETEVDEGVLRDENRARKALVFARSIKQVDDVKRNEGEQLVKKYFDSNLVDSSRLLENLRTDLGKVVGENKFYKLDVDWVFGKGVTIATHPEYFREFGAFFEEETKEQILSDISSQGYSSANFDMKLLIEEVTGHAILAKNMRKISYTDDAVLKSVMEYIRGDESYKPLILHGIQGNGKSTLISKIADEVSTLHTSKVYYTLVLRFLGKTPTTRTINSTYFSILDQLSTLYELEAECDNYLLSGFKMKDILDKILYKIQTNNPREKIYILLDGLNELDKSDNVLEKLLFRAPSNTRLIYSIDSNSSLFRSIQETFIHSTSYLQLNTIRPADAKTLLEQWLLEGEPKRTLSQSQWKTVIENLLNKSKNTLLYLKLLSTVTSKWNSNHKPEMAFFVCTNANDTFEYILKSVEKKHDAFIFARCMFYLSVFPFGIQDSEMEDILNIDRDISRYVKNNTSKKQAKFPLALWFIIRSDLKEFLTFKQYDNVQVVNWTNKSMHEASYAQYVKPLSNEEHDTLLTNVIFYFLKVQDNQKLAVYYRETMKFNKRLLRTLPYFIFSLKDPYYKTNSLKKYIYYNCDFVYALMSIKDRLFIERAAEVWTLYMFFEMEKKRSTPDRGLIAPAIELATVSYGYQKNAKLMMKTPDDIYQILVNDKKVNFSENNAEINYLLDCFKNFKFKNYVDLDRN